jgi:hypothetical protein
MAAIPAATIFSDSYNRPNNTDIDAGAPTGMGGILGTMTYVERDELLHANAAEALILSNIENNQLHLADGPNMSVLYLNHNFTDAAITAADGMKIGLTIISNDGTLVDGGRYIGFGVGSTLAQASTAQFDFTAGAASAFRGSVGTSTAGHSDFFVDWNTNGGYFDVFKNGPTVTGGWNYTIPGSPLKGNDRLELELYFDDFNDNSPVTALILWNGTVVGTDSFAWDADGVQENYIGFSVRQNLAGFTVDDLTVEAIYNEHAQNPNPANGKTEVNPGTLVLAWNRGKDAVGNPNTTITKHYLYIAEGEPNFAGMTPITVNATSDPVMHDPISIDATDTDKIIYWRVDESIQDSMPNDPNTIKGFVWSFETIKTAPVITAQPVNQLTEAGQTVTISIGVTSASPEHYAWFKSADNANNTPGDDVSVGTDTHSLVISNAQVSDQGYYYCAVTNDVATVTSNTASLGVKRLVAYWTLDAADYVGGLYLDRSGEGHHAEPNVLPKTGSFVAGVDPAETGEALDTTVEPLSVADSGQWAAAAFTSEITVSAWLKWAGTNGAWQGIVSNRVSPSDGNFYIEIRQDNGNVQIGSPGGTDLIAGNLPVGEWTHVAVTASAAGRTIYFNGLPVITRTPANPITQLVVPLYFGALGRGTTLNSPFNGVMDDIRIFNYAKDGFGVADLYYDVLETSVCLNPDNVNMQYDVAGGGANGDQPDCKVNLADFAKFAQTWLNCGLYPKSNCL